MSVPQHKLEKSDTERHGHSPRALQWAGTSPIASGYRGGTSANTTTNPLHFEKEEPERTALPLPHAQESSSRQSLAEADGPACRLVQCLLDSLSAQIVLLDASAVIVMMNTPDWRRREANHPLSALQLAVGSNYLSACGNAAVHCSWAAGELANAVRAVLDGDPKKYSGEYACQHRNVQRWFQVMVFPAPAWRTTRAIVSHEEITAEKRSDAEERVRAVMIAKIATLSSREREILDRVVAGKSNKMIAYDLEISQKTVEKHRGNVMKKLRARNVADLVRQIVIAGCATTTAPVETGRIT